MSKYPGRIVTDLAPAGYSVFFTGTSFLSVPAGTAFAPGTGNFTIEAWVYPTSSGDRFIWTQTVTGTNYFVFQITTTTAALTMTASGGGTAILGPANSLVQNAWNHVAAVRSSGTVTVYVNGVGGTPTSNTLDLSNTTYTPTIGTYTHSTTTNVFAGFMSNLRYVKGTALYTANFTPPTQLFNVTNTSFLSFNSPAIVDQGTANGGSGFPITVSGLSTVSTFTPFREYVPYNPALGASTPGIWTVDEAMQAAATRQWNMYDPNFQSTTLLLHGNPTNAPTWLTDVSTNRFTLTPVNDVRAAGLTPFSTTSFPTSGSGYFDGTGDYLSYATGGSSAFDLSSGDWTIEAWVYRNVSGVAHQIINLFNSAGSNSGLSIQITAANLVQVDNGLIATTAAGTVSANTWVHVAVVRSAGNTQIYINGTAAGSAITQAPNAAQFFRIGITALDQQPMNGYISNIRVVKGLAVYTGNFTTPTAPLTATQAAGTNISAITGTQTSLLTLQNSQSANNNAFLDSSSNNFLITRNGNTTQGSFSPFSQTGWSGYMGSSGATVVSIFFNGESDFAFGTGDFTIELWIYLTPSGANQVIYDQRPGLTNGAYPTIYLNNSTTKLSYYVNTADRITQTSTFTYNTWHHVVITRTGTNTKMFVDGVQEGSTYTDSTSYLNGTNRPCTTNGNSNADGALGYLSNLRVVKGSGPYQGASSTITVPTSPLTPVTNTVLLTLQSNRFVDTNTQVAAKTVNVSNNPSVQSFSPFYPTAAYTPETIGGSGYFDGTGDYLSAAYSSGLDIGGGDFVLEAWVYITNLAGNTYHTVYSKRNAAPGYTFGVKSNGTLFAWNGTTEVNTTGNTVPQNAWTYVVWSSVSGTLRMFINGVSGYSNAYTISTNAFSSTIGCSLGNTGGATADFLFGYISGEKLIKGTGVTSVAVPIAPPSPTGSALCLNFTNAGVVDSTAKNVLETVGNAQISTTQSRFGGSSMFFDGTGDFISIRRTNLLLPVANQDFTFECWVYPTATPGAQGATIMGCGEYGTDDNWNVNINSSLQVSLYIWSANNSYTNTTRTVTVNAWNHIAVARSGTGTNNLKVFVNGIGQSFSVNNTLVGPTRNFSIGADENGDESVYTGYIDELRFTLGVGRYTADFTPQTSQWQDQ